MRRTTHVAALVICGAGLVACMTEDAPLAPSSTAPSAQVSSPGSRDRGGLLPLGNAPVSYFVCYGNTPDSGSALIGPLGGVVHFGPHELDVPPAALLTPTTITAHTLPGDTIAVRFEPQGLTFLLPATLQLSYAQCQPQPTQNLSIVYVNDLLNELLGLIQSIMDPTHQKVIGFVSHFSVYAVAE